MLPLQYFFVYIGWYGLYAICTRLRVSCLPILEVLAGDTQRFLEATSKIQWDCWCVYCISHVPALLTLDIPGYDDRNLLLIASS